MRLDDSTLSKRAAVRQSAVVLLTLLLAGCEDAPKSSTPKAAPEAAPTPAATPKPEAAPELEIDTVSTKVGFERALLHNPEGRAKLASLLEGAKRWIEGKDVKLVVNRKVKVAWVAVYLEELGRLSPSKVVIKTDTRTDYSSEQVFVPENKVDAPPCSVVGIVTSDYGTAVWKLSGGAAGKRGRGMGGPDLSMTGETIERLAKSCPDSGTFFVGVADGIEWGLAFDLGASSRKLEHAKFERSVLLGETPVPGHKVTLKR
jgi:hypothetical protein